MAKLSSFILPSVVIIILIHGLLNDVLVFDAFLEGSKKGIKTFFNLIPSLLALILMVSLLNSSQALSIISKLLAPLTKILGIPSELAPLCLLSPLSGSGSISMFEKLLQTHGADSFIGRVASVISSSTETTFYAISIYFGAVGIKKTKYTVFASLLADTTSFVLSALLVGLFFY